MTLSTKRTIVSVVFILASSLPLAIQAWSTANRGSKVQQHNEKKLRPTTSSRVLHASSTRNKLSIPTFSRFPADFRMSGRGDWRMALDLNMQQSQPPNMFLGERLFPTASIAVSPAVERRHISDTKKARDGENSETSSQSCDRLQKQQQQNQQRGVLGFDLFELEAHRASQVDLEAWGRHESNSDGSSRNQQLYKDNFFPVPKTWNSNAPPFAATSNTAPTNAALSSSRSSTLPAWLPWIPTKSQILCLKVVELKEACRQRSLAKTGNKSQLQQRLLNWATEQQQQHKERLLGDFLVDWFEDTSAMNPPVTATSITKTNGTDLESVQSPNSLGEWARNVDLNSLFEKRKKIHREKRTGRPTTKSQQRKGQQNNARDTADKDYLTKLTEAIKAPSSPYSSNVKVKELYMASKKADQLGERGLAIELLQTLLEVTPNDNRVCRRLARMYSEQGDLSLARATLQHGLRLFPENPWLWHGLGQLELKHGSSKQARKYFQRAINFDPAFAFSYHALGTLEHTQGNIAKAMKILKQGIQYCPTNHRLHHALGDLYRGAKMLDDAERSYKRTLEHSPYASRSFAYSALAAVAYEKGDIIEARSWLKKSVSLNRGRHSQGWLALSHMEEAEGNFDVARKICILGIDQYELGLIKKHKYYSETSPLALSKMNKQRKHHEETKIQPAVGPESVETKDMLLRQVAKYRYGDKFLILYRNWARLEERHGNFESVDEAYRRASIVFPHEFKITLGWARYYEKTRMHARARALYMEACNQARNRHADPYRLYGELEMSLGNYDQARKILFRGAQAVSQSSDGGLGNRRGLAELFHTWALCEWHLGNLARAEVLFDHALRLTEAGEKGSKLRAFVFYSIALLEYRREKFHLSQHCLGLCLKENVMPGGNKRVWELWAKVALGMGNKHLEQECRTQIDKVSTNDFDSKQDFSELLSGDANGMVRTDPWHAKLRETAGFGRSQMGEKFYSFSKFPNAIETVSTE